MQLLTQERSAHLMNGDIAGQGGYGQQQIEKDTHKVFHQGHTAKSLFKNIGQSDEDQRRTTVGLHTYREGGGEDNETCQDGHQGVNTGNLKGRRQQFGFAFEITGISTQTAHCYTQGEKRLAEGFQESLPRYFREIRLQQEFHAFPRIRQGKGTNHQHDQQHEELRHHNLGSLLDAVLHAMDNHEMGKANQEGTPHNRFDRMCGESSEILLEIIWRTMDITGNRREDILQRPATHHAVIAKNQSRGKHAEIAHQFPGRTIAHDGIGSSCIGLCMATDHHLAKHHGNTHHKHTSDIYEDKGSTAVLPGHIRKTPHIAQTDSTAGSGKNNA